MCFAFINCWESVDAYIVACGSFTKVRQSLLGEFLNCSTTPIHPPLGVVHY